MKRDYYSASVKKFLEDNPNEILGELTRHHNFDLEDLQKNAWLAQIEILQNQLKIIPDAYIAFEYAIPRMGKRVDVVILYAGIVYILEFKVGETHYSRSAIEQALDYAVDLKNFHEQSHILEIVPIVVATEACEQDIHIHKYPDSVYCPINANCNNLASVILKVSEQVGTHVEIEPEKWLASIYKPTPTIIEAAQALYRGHSVDEISRSDAGAINLSVTSEAISEIIEFSKVNKRKSICFITGVPGAGKTLAGLNIANERHDIDKGEHAVFLSGNGPLVQVLQEALARNEVAEQKNASQVLTKKEALRKTKAFIQIIHHFRDDNLHTDRPPIERVAVFDEAQRAWTLEQTRSFMRRKKGILDFSISEPEYLVGVFDRHEGYTTIICLIGGGQEINTGEAGLEEWFSAVGKKYPHWDVYVSDKLTDYEYTNGNDIYSLLKENQLAVKNELHLSVSVRSYRSEKVSAWVKAVLDLNADLATALYTQIKEAYPIVITRDLDSAKSWLRTKARGSEGVGVTASSGGYRLRPYGIHVNSKISPENWFLNSKDDVRASGFLEEVATEFDIQGLELDWTCVAWDANLRLNGNGWEYKNFRGTEWQNVNDSVRQRYLLNSYRVLLTRARQGMVIFIPEGDSSDRTRFPAFYEPIYQYFLRCGISCI